MTTALAASASVVAATEALSGRDGVVVGMDDDPVSLAALRLAATEAAYRNCSGSPPCPVVIFPATRVS